MSLVISTVPLRQVYVGLLPWQRSSARSWPGSQMNTTVSKSLKRITARYRFYIYALRVLDAAPDAGFWNRVMPACLRTFPSIHNGQILNPLLSDFGSSHSEKNYFIKPKQDSNQVCCFEIAISAFIYASVLPVYA